MQSAFLFVSCFSSKKKIIKQINFPHSCYNIYSFILNLIFHFNITPKGTWAKHVLPLLTGSRHITLSSVLQISLLHQSLSGIGLYFHWQLDCHNAKRGIFRLTFITVVTCSILLDSFASLLYLTCVHYVKDIRNAKSLTGDGSHS